MTLKNKRSGFTIVELLIVIVVIGILAGLVIVTFNGIQQKGRNTERTTDIKAIEAQIEAYNSQNGRYPTLANLNDNDGDTSWVGQNLKGLKREALRDPKQTGYTMAGAPAQNVYSYVVTSDTDGICDNGATAGGADCAKYTITATYEGGGTLELKGSN